MDPTTASRLRATTHQHLPPPEKLYADGDDEDDDP